MITSSMQPSTRTFAVWLVLLASAGTFAVTMGSRQTMGLFMSPLNTQTGLGIASISLAFAVGQLWWGLTQPFAGAVADKIGAGRVVLLGVFLVALGSFLTPYMTTLWGLIFTIGILSAGGAGMAGPSVLMAATNRLLPPEKRSMAAGIVNAGGSFGQFLFAPIVGLLLAGPGWVVALQALGVFALLALPAAWVLKGNASGAIAAGAGSAPAKPPLSSGQALRQALRTPSYLLLAIGFFVCGFHVAFLGTHLPGVVASCGLSTTVASWSIALLGLFNIVGSLGIGWAMTRWRSKSLLSLIYAVRGVAVLIFVFAPKTPEVMLVFAAVMGITFLSTVPPTAGLVAKFFGPSNMAMLFGVVMVTHQLGGFLGAYLGGRIFAATDSYNWVWYIDIMLAVGAALIHLPIKESAPVRAVKV
jgi:MFS family permease